MKRSIALLVLLCFVTTGCTGSFNLTKKVYNMHRSQGDKWQDELIFLVCVLVPVYGISTFADAIVFNSIEFWTGENPVKMSAVKDQKGEATLSFNKENNQVTINSKTNAGAKTVILERKSDGSVLAKDQNGGVLYSAARSSNGDVVVYDKDLKLVKAVSTDESARLQEKFMK